MTTPIANVDNTTLNNLTPNLDTGDVADPALRKAAFQYIYTEMQTIITAYNAFVAAGGIATGNLADLSVTTSKLADLAVTTGKIPDLAIVTAKINDLAVTAAKIAVGTITSAQIADLSIATGDLADSLITTAKLADINVTTGKLADASVTLAKMAAASVGTSQLVDGSVTDAKIASGVITADKFIAGALNNDTQNGLLITALQAETVTGLVNAKTGYGCTGDGVTDEIIKMRLAVAAAANKVLVIPYGTYMLSDQLVIDNPMTIWCFGTLKPSTAGVAGTSLIKITSSNVKISGFGRGMIDGNSKLWCGIYAESSTAVLENITVDWMKLQNVAIDSISATVINFSSVKNGKVTDNWLYNCGVVGNVSGGGFGIYLQFCQSTSVKRNRLEKVGSTAINVSGGLNNDVSDDNDIYKATLFGLKSGYGLTTSVSADAAATTTSFTIAKTADTTKQWFVGQAFVIIEGDTTLYTGTVATITDHSTYYTITTLVAMEGTPSSGKTIELPDTGTTFHCNKILYSGDNAIDVNVTHGMSIIGNKIKFAGLYRDVGTFSGLNCGIWVGADDQGSVTCLKSKNVTIADNDIEYCGGSGISSFNTDNLDISSSNKVKDFNLNNTAGYCGIEAGRLGSNRLSQVKIASNQVIANSGNGYGIFSGYFLNALIKGNQVVAKLGVQINAASRGDVLSNQIVATADSAYGLLISDTSGGNATSGLNIIGNDIAATGATSVGVGITDTGASLVVLSQDNTIAATTKVSDSSTAKIAYEYYSISIASKVVAAIYESVARAYVATVASGTTITIAQFTADNGTAGKVIVEGIARDGTTNAEDFTVRANGGYLATDTVTFTSNGAPRGAAFLASGDFTLVANGTGGLMDFKYTNNEAGPVSLNLQVTAISRY